MNSIYDALSPDTAAEVQQLARLIYETRENRRAVLAAAGADDPAQLIERIAAGELAEHPAYEHYLAARILTDTHQAARQAMAQRLQEVNGR
ncbi:hypothetical protein [Thauera chlorobenzoica]|uniref:Uncharacterized protein n=1 Tax=Thauera chlorobenzoica TaxID=96773 RepID=A0A1H5XKN9_9RHOO|nr:hypothetical protein [Thauera chlorobenzoica]APR03424.1 hypothetical protein Tchl_0558 [Thauera chlorobenzoica]SEG11806.1 hypothetical protein SAMN05216242_11830 [Thauera chlorobenzoica]